MLKGKLFPLIALLLAGVIGIAGCSVSSAADHTTPSPTPTDIVATPTENPEDILPETTPDEETLPAVGDVMFVSGTITDIKVDGSEKVVTIVNAEGGVAEFIVNADTWLADDTAYATGSPFTGWFDATLPMTLQYPPRYTALAILTAQLPEGQTLKIDIFDHELIASDGMLKLQPDLNTQVLDREGNLYEGGIMGELLAVFYGVSTRGIPALTTPDTIVVLSAQAEEEAETTPTTPPTTAPTAPPTTAPTIPPTVKPTPAPTPQPTTPPTVTATYRGNVTAITYSADGTILTLQQEAGGNYGYATLQVLLTGDTKYGFDPATVAIGDLIDAVYAKPTSGAVTQPVRATSVSRIKVATPSTVFHGTITDLRRDGGRIMGIVVESLEGRGTAVFLIDENTVVFAIDGGLTVGSRVSVSFNGAMASSNPPQATASEIRAYTGGIQPR